MPECVISKAARSDLRDIARYTTKTWGADQAVRYTAGLQDCFQMLAQRPGMGRACGAVSEGLRRFETGKHAIFYLGLAEGILIVRILHQQMLPAKSRFET